MGGCLTIGPEGGWDRWGVWSCPGELCRGHCPGLRCGDGVKGSRGTTSGARTYLGRVLRCFE